MFHFTLFFHFTIFHLLPYSQDNTMTESALLLVFFLTNQKLIVDYQCHVPRDYLAQEHGPFSPSRMWKCWEQRSVDGLWLLCLFKSFF